MPALYRWIPTRVGALLLLIGIGALPKSGAAQAHLDAQAAIEPVVHPTVRVTSALGPIPSMVALRRPTPALAFVVPPPPRFVPPRRPPYVIMGALVGAGVGAALAYHSCRRDDCMTPLPFVILTGGGGAVGAISGWIIDRLTAPIATVPIAAELSRH